MISNQQNDNKKTILLFSIFTKTSFRSQARFNLTEIHWLCTNSLEQKIRYLLLRSNVLILIRKCRNRMFTVQFPFNLHWHIFIHSPRSIIRLINQIISRRNKNACEIDRTNFILRFDKIFCCYFRYFRIWCVRVCVFFFTFARNEIVFARWQIFLIIKHRIYNEISVCIALHSHSCLIHFDYYYNQSRSFFCSLFFRRSVFWFGFVCECNSLVLAAGQLHQSYVQIEKKKTKCAQWQVHKKTTTMTMTMLWS